MMGHDKRSPTNS